MIISKIKNIRENTAFRYLFIGGMSYGIELSVLIALSEIFKFSPLLSVGISFWIGLAISFVLQKFLAFSNKTVERKHIVKQSLQYGLLVFINYTFTLWLVSAIEPIIGLFVARTLALVITTLWNYFIYAKIIFKKDTSDE